MLTHIKSGYGFESVYISDTYTFLIHIRFCSLCILLRRKVLACSTHLLASMTDHPKPGSTFYVHALCITKLSLLAVLIATPETVRSLVQVIYRAGRTADIKENLVHYAYSEVSSLMKPFLTS